MQSKKLAGIRIDSVGVDEVIKKIMTSIEENKKTILFYLNIHAFYISFKDEVFKKILNKGDLVFCDGFGVKIGAKMRGMTIGERMTPPDWIDQLCYELSLKGKSLFLLGDEPGIADKCAEKLLKTHPQLKIVGTYHGFFDKEGKENDEVVDMINKSDSDVLLIGFGMPLQEKWIEANCHRINTKVFLPVGAMFRWVSGIEKRAPRFLSSNGFEGVWRLITNPGKVWKRYLVEVPIFFFRILKESYSLNRTKSEFSQEK